MRDWSKKKLRKFFCNGLLAFIDGTLLPILFMSVINVTKAGQGVVSYDTSFALAVVFLLLISSEMIGLTIFFCKRYD